MTKVGGQACAIGNFIKYGGATILTHYKAMPANCIFAAIVTRLQVTIVLPYPLLNHDPPICIINDAMGFIILWPWKLTKKCM